jgi:hypothetical protein
MAYSRQDFYFGDNHSFNETIFDQTRSYWTDDTVTIQMAANARLARYATSNATNPTFNISELGNEFSIGESAAYVTLLGDKISSTVKRSFVEYLFGKNNDGNHYCYLRFHAANVQNRERKAAV